MAVKKFRFIAEQIFRCSVEVNVDLDELRKNDKYKHWTDEEILLDYSVQEQSGVFDRHNDWSLEESNVRSIYGEDGEEVYID